MVDDPTRRDRQRGIGGPSGDLGAFVPETNEARYSDVEALGAGGMGDLRGVMDSHLNRLIAMKVLKREHETNPESVARLMREAMIQGQLEHPSIVPVYDAGIFQDRPFFTMKRIRGTTLKDRLKEQRRERGSSMRFSRRRLLTAFSSVCMAVDFAHQRGIVHRDLKPSNVMLGDFGEVYVLDWGVAKLIDEPPTGPIDRSSVTERDRHDSDDLSSTGEVFGTPGYIAPEQLLGKTIDERTDVFALGAILFELLTCEKLFEGETAQQKIDATLAGARVEFRAAQLDLPPELARICAKAVALEPDQRYSTARDMHGELEKYLDGDRDVELRRELAAKHAAASEEWAERAMEGHDDELLHRKKAMQNVSRALALDPGNETAISTFVRLLTDPPKRVPDEVRARVEREATTNATSVLSGARVTHFAVLLFFTPMIALLGVRSWTAFAVLVGLNAAAAGVDALVGRWLSTRRGTDIVFLVSVAWTMSTSLMFGPFFVVPTTAAINTMGYLLVRRRGGALFAWALGSATFVLPAILELTGVIPASMTFSDAGLTVHPVLHDFPAFWTQIFLIATGLGALAATAGIVVGFRRALNAAEQRVHVQAWQLRQLLPIRTGAPT